MHVVEGYSLTEDPSFVPNPVEVNEAAHRERRAPAGGNARSHRRRRWESLADRRERRNRPAVSGSHGKLSPPAGQNRRGDRRSLSRRTRLVRGTTVRRIRLGLLVHVDRQDSKAEASRARDGDRSLGPGVVIRLRFAFVSPARVNRRDGNGSRDSGRDRTRLLPAFDSVLMSVYRVVQRGPSVLQREKVGPSPDFSVLPARGPIA